MNEVVEREALVREIMRLMSGPPLGDGIGPFNTAHYLSRVHGFALTGEEVWTLWRRELDRKDSSETMEVK